MLKDDPSSPERDAEKASTVHDRARRPDRLRSSPRKGHVDMELDAQAAIAGSAFDGALGMPRILQDLAQGNLNDDEAATVASWLGAAFDDEPPAWVVHRAVSIAKSARWAKAG